MKRNLVYITLSILTVSCQDEIVEQYKALEPQYMSYTDLRKAVKTSDSTVLEHPGKIYYWNKYLFINEQGKGVHIFDDSNPASPVKKTFIKIPGNVDISVKDGILYADSYIDLVAIDISDLNNINEKKRIQDVFDYTLPPYDQKLKLPYDVIDKTRGVVIGYKIKTIEKELVDRPIYPIYWERGINTDYYNAAKQSSGNTSTGGGSSAGATGIGTGGSMARFTIVNNALYAITSYKIIIFNVETVAGITKKNELYTGWSTETVFPFQNKLFIGTQTGMMVYSIIDPFNPEKICDFWHITSCDPVVVNEKFAFITLRNGTTCNNNTVNRLDVVNISTITNPILEKSYLMTNPHGLALDNNTLFICDGDAGLKIYDATDVTKIDQHLLASYPNNQAFDVIPVDSVLLMIGDDGFYQYNYKDLTNISLISSIHVAKSTE